MNLKVKLFMSHTCIKMYIKKVFFYLTPNAVVSFLIYYACIIVAQKKMDLLIKMVNGHFWQT